MATENVTYYRNYNINDNTSTSQYKITDPAPSITEIKDLKTGENAY